MQNEVTETNKTHETRGRKCFKLPRGYKADWKKSNVLLAEELNVNALTVMRLRKRLGIKANPRGRPESKTVMPASSIKEALAEILRIKRQINSVLGMLTS